MTDVETLPTGTITFLRSDVEGSMRLVQELGSRFDEVNAQHQALVRSACAEYGGQEVRTEGDAFFVVFCDAHDAVRAAVAIQKSIAVQAWPAGVTLRVRIGLHAGSAYRAGDDYGGLEVNR
ncbi:MAG TPA: adenylate/guanylate cyclase domain-containing protein, partial [Actinomycetes bacterium]|nr:adenylate/guanylate cyclase domain-containing protein [Actinomycetes bacterium]